MKVFISADIEGTNGIADWDETEYEKPRYAYFAAKMTDEVGAVSSIRLPFFGYGLDVTDGRIDLDFRVHVTGSKGKAGVHADFVDGAITDAYLLTAEGQTIPLVIPD